MSRRRGRPMRTYVEVSRELATAAAQEGLRPVIEALVLEVLQFHSATHPECREGCPALVAVADARKAVGPFKHWALK